MFAKFLPRLIIGGFDDAFPGIFTGYIGGILATDGRLREHKLPFRSRRFGAQHYRATCERDRVGGSNGNIFSDGDGHRAFGLPVAKKQRKYQRSDGCQLHDAGNDKRRQRRKV